MSHGKGRAPKIPIGVVKVSSNPTALRLALATPGSPEWFDVYRDMAAKLIRDMRRQGPYPGSGTTYWQWNAIAKRAGRKLLDDEGRKYP